MAKSKAKKGTKPSSATSGTSAGHSGSAVTNTTDHDLNPTDLVGGSSAILTNKERKKKGYVQSGKLASAQRGIEDMDLDEPESDSEGQSIPNYGEFVAELKSMKALIASKETFWNNVATNLEAVRQGLGQLQSGLDESVAALKRGEGSLKEARKELVALKARFDRLDRMDSDTDSDSDEVTAPESPKVAEIKPVETKKAKSKSAASKKGSTQVSEKGEDEAKKESQRPSRAERAGRRGARFED